MKRPKRNLKIGLIISGFIAMLAVTVLVILGTANFQAAVTGPNIYLTPPSGSADQGSNIVLDIMVDTAGQAAWGFDIRYLKFDSSKLEVVGSQVQTGDINAGFTSFSANTVDNTAGTVLLGATFNNKDADNNSVPFTGSGKAGTITFKVKAGSNNVPSIIGFDFVTGSTLFTKISGKTGDNILAGVSSASYILNGTNPPPAVPTVNITANSQDGPVSIDSGQSVTLGWNATPADNVSCVPSGSWSGDAKAASGTELVSNITSAKTFTLTCTNASGSASDSVVVNINSQPVLPDVELTVNDKSHVTVTSGSNVTLKWSSSEAISCTASGNWSGTQKTSGTSTLGPITASKTYVLTCSNNVGSVHDKVNVYIENQAAPVVPIVDLKVNNSNSPASVDYNGTANLSWTTTNADSCAASNGWTGNKATNGEESTGKLTQSKTYTLTCQKGDASAVDSVTVNVSGQEPATPGPSDGNQVVNQVTTPSDQVTTQIPSNIITNKTVAEANKTQQRYQGGTVKPWAMWLFYGLIPVALTAGVVFFYLLQKRRQKDFEFDDQNSNWPNY